MKSDVVAELEAVFGPVVVRRPFGRQTRIELAFRIGENKRIVYLLNQECFGNINPAISRGERRTRRFWLT